jgi:hypothetical protein
LSWLIVSLFIRSWNIIHIKSIVLLREVNMTYWQPGPDTRMGTFGGNYAIDVTLGQGPRPASQSHINAPQQHSRAYPMYQQQPSEEDKACSRLHLTPASNPYFGRGNLQPKRDSLGNTQGINGSFLF